MLSTSLNQIVPYFNVSDSSGNYFFHYSESLWSTWVVYVGEEWKDKIRTKIEAFAGV